MSRGAPTHRACCAVAPPWHVDPALGPPNARRPRPSPDRRTSRAAHREPARTRVYVPRYGVSDSCRTRPALHQRARQPQPGPPRRLEPARRAHRPAHRARRSSTHDSLEAETRRRRSRSCAELEGFWVFPGLAALERLEATAVERATSRSWLNRCTPRSGTWAGPGTRAACCSGGGGRRWSTTVDPTDRHYFTVRDRLRRRATGAAGERRRDARLPTAVRQPGVRGDRRPVLRRRAGLRAAQPRGSGGHHAPGRAAAFGGGVRHVRPPARRVRRASSDCPRPPRSGGPARWRRSCAGSARASTSTCSPTRPCRTSRTRRSSPSIGPSTGTSRAASCT